MIHAPLIGALVGAFFGLFIFFPITRPLGALVGWYLGKGYVEHIETENAKIELAKSKEEG